MQDSIIPSQFPKNSSNNFYQEELSSSSETNTYTSSSKTYNSKKLENNLLCEYCQKLFSTKGNLRKHINKIHKNNRPFKCTFPNCKKEYECESRLIIHERTHTGIKPFVCQICQKSFNERGNLKAHLKFHLEIRPFKCPLCDNTYKTNNVLKDHIKINHYKIKKFNCQFCDKNFGTNSALKKHIIKHTKEKKFKCKFVGCEKCFTEKRNMEKHYIRHIQNYDEKIIKAKVNKNYDFNIFQKDTEEEVNIAIGLFDFINNKKDEELKIEEKNEMKNKIDNNNNMSKENHTNLETFSNELNSFPSIFNLSINISNNVNG